MRSVPDSMVFLLVLRPLVAGRAVCGVDPAQGDVFDVRVGNCFSYHASFDDCCGGAVDADEAVGYDEEDVLRGASLVGVA